MSDRASVICTADRITYRASSFGYCIRRLVAARLGYDAKPPPARLQQAFDEGHELEPIILETLVEDYGWQLEQPQAEMSLHLGTGPDGRELYIDGHVDALGTQPGGSHWMPVDAKAFAQSTMDDFLASGLLAYPHYAWQQSAYCEGFGSDPFCLPLWNKATQQLTVKVYDTHPYTYDDIQERIYDIEERATAPEALTDIECPGSWGCPYDYLHDARPVDRLPDELASVLSSYLLARRKAATYATAQKVLAGVIQKGLPEDGTSTFEGEGATVSLVNNGKRINTQKVKELLTEAGLDPDDYYTPGEGKHITVKEKP
jgi:hypothetical protein